MSKLRTSATLGCRDVGLLCIKSEMLHSVYSFKDLGVIGHSTVAILLFYDLGACSVSIDLPGWFKTSTNVIERARDRKQATVASGRELP